MYAQNLHGTKGCTYVVYLLQGIEAQVIHFMKMLQVIELTSPVFKYSTDEGFYFGSNRIYW